MVGATNETILAGIVKIIGEILVNALGALRCLNDDETNRTTINHGAIAQTVPIDGALIMGNVDTVYLIACRIFGVAIKRAPPETRGTHKEIIKRPNVKNQDSNTSKKPRPTPTFLHERQQ